MVRTRDSAQEHAGVTICLNMLPIWIPINFPIKVTRQSVSQAPGPEARSQEPPSRSQSALVKDTCPASSNGAGFRMRRCAFFAEGRYLLIVSDYLL